MKASPLSLVVAHYQTYIDDATGKQRWQDHVLFLGMPLAMFGVCGYFETTIPSAASAGLVTVSGLLSAFLFGAMLQVSQRALDWADTNPTPSEAVTEHAEFLRQLAANAGYSSLVSILTASVFVLASVVSDHDVAGGFTALGLALALHMALVLLMVMSRVFALTEERLIRAETGGANVTQIRARRNRGKTAAKH